MRGQRVLNDDGHIESTEWFANPAGLVHLDEALRGEPASAGRAPADAKSGAAKPTRAAAPAADAAETLATGQAPPVSRPSISAAVAAQAQREAAAATPAPAKAAAKSAAAKPAEKTDKASAADSETITRSAAKPETKPLKAVTT